MWELKDTEQFARRQKKMRKKRPRELLAVAFNLNRFHQALIQGTPPKQIQGSWIHPEPMDVLALDQRGANEALGGAQKAKGLAETRLYIYPQVSNETLHTITLGDKSTQSDDIQYCKNYVGELNKQEEQQLRA